MDRLISEKQVLDVIADFIKNNDSVAKLILNINAIPSAEPKWTPVGEGLSETDDDVLVTADNGEMYFGFIYKYGSKNWYIDSKEYHEPMAWMPSPKPYRKGR